MLITVFRVVDQRFIQIEYQCLLVLVELALRKLKSHSDLLGLPLEVQKVLEDADRLSDVLHS